MDHNPFLKPWHRPAPNQEAGKGDIERPGEVENLVWQTRAAVPTEYEHSLADALIACFEEGIEEAKPLVEALNARGITSPDGRPWTVKTFEQEMARLGA